MFKFLDNLAFKITKENWGFPWHIILALILSRISLFFLLKEIDLSHAIAFSWTIVNIVGLMNEIWEKYKKQNPKKDFWQDMLANNIGWIIGILL